MKKLNTLFVLLLVAGAAVAQGTWAIDKVHSKLRFSITHLMVSEAEGAFNTIDAKLTTVKDDDLTGATIEFTADAASVDTDNADRDKHVKNPDFLDVEKYPTITFKSKSVTKTEGKKYKVTGDLTLHGVTKPVTLDVTFNGTAVHPYTKKTIAGFKVSGVIKRADFGVGTTTPTAVLGDEINVSANAEFIKG